MKDRLQIRFMIIVLKYIIKNTIKLKSRTEARELVTDLQNEAPNDQ